MHWNYEQFAALSETEQKQRVTRIFEESEVQSNITDTEEFSSAQSEANGSMYIVDEYDISEVVLDDEEREVRATFDYTASCYDDDEDNELGGTLSVSGTAVLVIDADGEASLGAVSAEANYPEHDDEDDMGDPTDTGQF